MVFVNFHQNQIEHFSVQIKKMKDEIFSFHLKKKLLLPNVKMTMLDLKMYPLPHYFTRILKSYHKKNDKKNSQKNRSGRYHMR